MSIYNQLETIKKILYLKASICMAIIVVGKKVCLAEKFDYNL